MEDRKDREQLNESNEAEPCVSEPREGELWEAARAEDHFPTYEEFRDIVADLLDELPEAFFTELSGGVLVEENVERSPLAVADDLYNLGVYRVNNLGRQIAIFYGTFAHIFPHLRGEALKDKVRDTVRHEFRHHLEFLAGIHNSSSLEAEDERQIRRYLERHGG